MRARVRGKLQFLSPSLPEGVERNHSSVFWILQAQLGTLDKMKSSFALEAEPGTFELLAIARNLFENVIWLRLFNREREYGLLFYEQLLKQQKQNTEMFIAKANSEISLFHEFERIDGENLDFSFFSVLEGNPTDEEIQAAQVTHRNLTDDLDNKARRAFSIYASAAKFNGYGYQCNIIREKELPRQLLQLAEIQKSLDKLCSAKWSILSEPMFRLSKVRWNWKDRANDVGMIEQYNFLYAYTSRLLHSTPMNLITEKQLSASESAMMLDYAFITILDIFDLIDSFSFPGQANVAVFDL